MTDLDLYRRGLATLLASWAEYARGRRGAATRGCEHTETTGAMGMGLVDAPAPSATAQAAAFATEGRPAGWLAAWARGARPTRAARRVDARIIDAGGPCRAAVRADDRTLRQQPAVAVGPLCPAEPTERSKEKP